MEIDVRFISNDRQLHPETVSHISAPYSCALTDSGAICIMQCGLTLVNF